MKAFQLLLVLATFQVPNFLFSQTFPYFESRGTGGGGALFCPSPNPLDGSEIYLASDLGGLYHTTGQGYEVVRFTAATTGPFGKVCFTQNNGIRYALIYDPENFTTRPARSLSAGLNWDIRPGDDQPWEDKLFIFSDFHNPDRVLWTDYNNLYFSNDGGQTAPLKYTADDPGAGILLSGAFFDGDNIWLGTNDGVLHSSNGGNSFTPANFTGIPNGEVIIGFGGGNSGNLTRFFALTGDPGNVWATNMGYNYWETVRGVYTMDNLSGTWTPKMNGLDISEDFVVWLGMADNDPSTCYLSGSSPNGQPIVMKTANGGDSWQHVFLTEGNQNIRTGYAGDGGDFSWWWAELPLGFSVNRLNSQQVIMTDFGFMHQTLDGGQTWQQGYTDPDFDHPAGAETPTKQPYRSIGLEQTTCWQVFWFDEDNLFACFTDIKGMRSEDGGLTWSFDYTGHDQNTMYRIAKHNTQPLWFGATSTVHDIYQTTYVTDARLQPSYKAGKMLYTTDKGKTWLTMHDFGNPVIWVTPDASNNDRLYAGVISTNPSVGGVWRADGIGNPATATWTKLPNPAANNGRIFNIHSLNDGTLVTTWSARKSNSGSVFSDSSGVFVSTNGGQSWERRNHSDMNYWTKDLVVDPNEPAQNTWYACVWSGWGGPANDLGGLFRTTDRGMNWEKITGDGQFHRVSSVALTHSGTYLSTESEGLWQSTNDFINVGQPDWYLTNYSFHHPERVFGNPNPSDFNKYIWIASFGNGMKVNYTGNTGTTNVVSSPSANMRLVQNPVHQSIDIEVVMKKAGAAQFSILDVQGRTVRDFPRQALVVGKQQVSFTIQGLAAGNYFLRMTLSTGETLALKMVAME